MDTKPALKTYRGNCHCAALVFEVDMPELKSGGECNCTICTKKGCLWVGAPRDAFRIVKGDEDALTTYRFGTGAVAHKFCPSCATALFCSTPTAPPGREFVINAHALQDVGRWDLDRHPLDGAGWGAPFQAPKYAGPEPSADIPDANMYYGSCHCGAVTLALKTAPLDKDYPDQVIECSCSICSINNCIWIYPTRKQIAIQGEENLSSYRFGNRQLRKMFCKICGINFINEAADLTDEELAALPEPIQKWHDKFKSSCGLNVRVLNDFDLKSLKEPMRNTRGADFLPLYVKP